MTVYNRKMFRKKGGGATGIMASGPELIKAQSGSVVNIPGGGSTLQRSGFPGLRAFGGLGQTIPSQFRVPTLEEILAAGGPTTNTRASTTTITSTETTETEHKTANRKYTMVAEAGG